MSGKTPEIEHPTTLTNEQFARCWNLAESFVKKNGTIRNKQMREVSGIGYDQAIGFFKRATSEKRLLRKGTASGTHYVLKKK
jgi:hypothetical protein